MSSQISQRVQKSRNTLRAKGFRPIQIWVPDTRLPDFAAESARQTRLVTLSDRRDKELDPFLDAALLDLDGDSY